MVLLSKTSPARRTQLGQSGWWMATSRVSRGKLLVNMKKGESVPDDWALAIDGSRTTDAAQAFRGILLPLGYKGYGMAVIVDMLSGVLKAAASASRSIRRRTSPSSAAASSPSRQRHSVSRASSAAMSML